jgi:hypothetical protein
MMRGATRNRIGSIPIVSRESICSPMRMMPISAAMADPALPVTISAESTGPSSRMRDNATVGPSSPSEPNLRRV